MLPGDWFLLIAGALTVLTLVPLILMGGPAEKAVVKRDGVVLAELPLDAARQIRVEGALANEGATVIETRPGAARVASDPGPRQYCVQQGWLTRSGAIAICAPSHISLQLIGHGEAAVDTLAY